MLKYRVPVRKDRPRYAAPLQDAQRAMGLLWLATSTGADAPSPESAHALGAWLLNGSSSGASPIFFAIGSTCFSWLFLRGLIIPAVLAWLGVVASVLLVIMLPLQLAGAVPGRIVQFCWIPMAAFEIPLGLWLIIKGAAMPVAPAIA